MIRGILFDKDGTLIEFSGFWAESFEALLTSFQFDKATEEEIRRRVGIDENFQVIENSIMASGTLEDLAVIFGEYTGREKAELEIEISEFFFDRLKENPQTIKGICDIKSLFRKLKEDGYVIGVVTADSYPQSKYTFEVLGCWEYISFLATGDRYPNKPDPASLDQFCFENNLKRKEVVFVGDSLIDMEYGKLTAFSVGVATNPTTREILSKKADHIVETPCEIGTKGFLLQ